MQVRFVSEFVEVSYFEVLRLETALERLTSTISGDVVRALDGRELASNAIGEFYYPETLLEVSRQANRQERRQMRQALRLMGLVERQSRFGAVGEWSRD